MLRVSVMSQMALLHLGLSEASVEREKMFFYRLVKGLKLFGKTYFYTPEIEDRGAYCFCPVCHSVSHSVILPSSLIL